MNRRLLAIGLITFALVATAETSSFAQSTGPYFALPAWSQTLPASARFVPVLPVQVCVGTVCAQVAQAVLDRETGLVWDKVAGDTNRDGLVDFTDKVSWRAAIGMCRMRQIGNRAGWRLPTAQELLSLIDPTVSAPPSFIALPVGHPFVGVQNEGYWSATEDLDDPANDAFVVSFTEAQGSLATLKRAGNWMWCVRGGSGRDAQ